MTKPKPKGGVNPKLVRMVNRLLDEVMAEPKPKPDGTPAAEGEAGKPETPKFTLTDKMKVLDRALKLEAIRLKVSDEEGDFFTNRDKGGKDEDE